MFALWNFCHYPECMYVHVDPVIFVPSELSLRSSCCRGSSFILYTKLSLGQPLIPLICCDIFLLTVAKGENV